MTRIEGTDSEEPDHLLHVDRSVAARATALAGQVRRHGTQAHHDRRRGATASTCRRTRSTSSTVVVDDPAEAGRALVDGDGQAAHDGVERRHDHLACDARVLAAGDVQLHDVRRREDRCVDGQADAVRSRRKKYPVVFTIYGGPGSQGVYDQFDASGWKQWLAQNGYIVVDVNNRGTNNYGRDFMKVVYKQLGKYESEGLRRGGEIPEDACRSSTARTSRSWAAATAATAR